MLQTFTIYYSPADYPGFYVVRAWTVGRDGLVAGDAITALSLEAARRLVPAGLYLMPRDPADDPTIVETWI